jgi:hypothetical protein
VTLYLPQPADGANAILDGGLVHYQCKEDDRQESLHLNPEDAEYLGIDMSVRERPKTGF